MPEAKNHATDRQPPVIVWLRDNLRLADNRALSAAADTGQPMLVVYVYDDASPSLRPLAGPRVGGCTTRSPRSPAIWPRRA
jgi:hypothetical protein